jgi:hypothetical protein
MTMIMMIITRIVIIPMKQQTVRVMTMVITVIVIIVILKCVSI